MTKYIESLKRVFPTQSPIKGPYRSVFWKATRHRGSVRRSVYRSKSPDTYSTTLSNQESDADASGGRLVRGGLLELALARKVVQDQVVPLLDHRRHAPRVLQPSYKRETKPSLSNLESRISRISNLESLESRISNLSLESLSLVPTTRAPLTRARALGESPFFAKGDAGGATWPRCRPRPSRAAPGKIPFLQRDSSNLERLLAVSPLTVSSLRKGAVSLSTENGLRDCSR